MAGIGKWKKELKYATEHLPIYSSVNADHPDCPQCGGTMNFYGHDENGDFEYGEGYWECPDCGFKFTESEF